ncbi:MAG: alpha-amylase family glycosyl hydrolase [Bacteroides sp.]|nr:alpha-amylase family glycosyl hydrolase [Bacteroides sp.]MCM1095848.1 alpha-amylase family glycosyl hydrolase [Terasakiella sp.]
MRNIFTLAAGLAAWCSVAAASPVVTSEPPVLQTSSTGITVTFHADRGNRGLADLPEGAEVYAHTGVITNLSTGDSNWKHASTWGKNEAKYLMKRLSTNVYTLDIGSIDTYYGITDPTEKVRKLAFVFRNATGTAEGKTASGGDILLDVYEAGSFEIALSSDCPDVLTGSSKQTFTVYSTLNAALSITVNGAPVKTGEGQSLTADYTFSSVGSYTVEATAKAGSVTRTERFTVSVVEPASEKPYPGGSPVMGPVADAQGNVTFCIAAPGKSEVYLRGSWNGYAIDSSSVMDYQTVDGVRYFWTTVPALDPAKDHIYFFEVDGVAVGDPYARLVLDPWNDRFIPATVFPDMPAFPSDVVSGTPVAVYSPAREAYDWQTTSFTRPAQDGLLIYELLIRDFTGTEGAARGSGTIAGVLDKLDYLRDLGVNAIELMPVMEFSGNNSWGYNTNFYFAPDKAYGTPADYKRLIDECHARGMAVILDIVFNQSDGQHPWYKMYPIAQNPFYNGTAPHGYSVLNDWNQDYPLVQRQWHDALRHWLTEYRVDGFRFDLVKGLGDNDSYGATYHADTNTWTGVTDAKTNAYNASRVARMKALHDAMRAVAPDAYFINENLAGAKEENEMAADGELNWANINNSSCQFAMGYTTDAALNRFYAPSDGRTKGSTVSYAESHDEERMAYKQVKYGVAVVKASREIQTRRLGSVAAQMLMAPGAHMIWQFQEFGADQTTKSANGGNNTSPKKVIWSYLDDWTNRGLMEQYKALMWMRRNNPEMFASDVNVQMLCGGWATGRTVALTKGDKAIYLAVNPNVDKEITVALPADVTACELMAHNWGTEPRATAEGVTLAPGAFVVYATRGMVNGITDADLDADRTAPAEYYDLRGARVDPDGLAPGIYIRRQGTRTDKIVIR